jgi:hypothetical protein
MATAGREPNQTHEPVREQKVFDDRGGEYILGERLSKGGQGTIVRIKGNARQIAKLANAKASDPATVAWAQQVARIRYLPVQDHGLPVVMPLAYRGGPIRLNTELISISGTRSVKLPVESPAAMRSRTHPGSWRRARSADGGCCRTQ